VNFHDLKSTTLFKLYLIFLYLREQNYSWQTKYTVQSLDRSKKTRPIQEVGRATRSDRTGDAQTSCEGQ